MREFVEKANKVAEKSLPIKTYFLSYEEAIKKKELFKLTKSFDKKLEKIRIVEICGFQRQADGGTHVASTSEVGKIIFLGAENKGKGRRRIYFTIEP
ncbi:MAG: alanyl-tRNA editing protein AlaX, partial [Candidatus Pacearchaeota archaeon]|nr:alanyl-tRNA editing protein AlaX [Candidatus Pacearchaeota archaeon]